MASDAGRSIEAGTEPIDDRDRHQPRNVAPVAPAMKAAQIVGPHDPDEVHVRATPQQIAERLVGVVRADLRFEIAHVDARMVGQRPRGHHALFERCETAGVLERIAGRDQPPQLKPDLCCLFPTTALGLGAISRQCCQR